MVDLSSFKVHKTLSPGIWPENNEIDPAVRERLVEIANDFYENLELGAEILDITLTGSLANYNWSKYSDVDLHIIVDFEDINENEDMVRQLVNSLKTVWNRTHDIKIKDYDVEVYIQDKDQPHHSGGLYSLMNDEWISVPDPSTKSFDPGVVEKKSRSLMGQINFCHQMLKEGRYDDAIESCNFLKEKIRKMRQAGLEEDGEFSNENIVFKVLRREGFLEKLQSVKTRAYDLKMTMTEEFSRRKT
jgi:hypothetical protein